MIELEAIARDFRVGDAVVHALQAVDLSIPDGDYCSIMGPSGSGKSTLLNILGCLDRPTRGTYRLDGQNVGQLDDETLSRIRGHRIGFVFQFYHLIPRLTAAANVELPMIFAGVERRERAGRVARALESVGLPLEPGTCRNSFRAAKDSAWPLPARSSWDRRCCWPTSRRAISTARRAPRSSDCSRA